MTVMMVLDTIFPLFAMLGLGFFLKRKGMTSDLFLQTSDRLVYFIFFPAMLFWKIGGSGPEQGLSTGLCLAGLVGVVVSFTFSLLALRLFKIPRFQAGSFCQACFRFNTYIGMALVLQTLGEEGVRHFGILAGVVIPLINVFSVSVLIWHSGQKMAIAEKAVYFIKALLSNPLILGCVAGFIFSRAGLTFPVFVHNTFSLMTSVTLPLALISIGGSLRFQGLSDHVRASWVAAALKLVLSPVMGFLLLTAFGVRGIPFQAGMIYFALPTSTAIYVLSGQLNSDTDLAATAIMVSTLASLGSLALVQLI